MFDDPMAEKIVRELRHAIDRLRADIDKVELWTVALSGFAEPIPDYEPGLRNMMLPAKNPDAQPGAEPESKNPSRAKTKSLSLRGWNLVRNGT